MDTDYRNHVGHTVKLDEYVEQNWELRWEDGELRRVQVTDETVIDSIDPRLYCFTCQKHLTGFDVSVI